MKRWLLVLILGCLIPCGSSAQIADNLDSWKGRIFFEKKDDNSYFLKDHFLGADSTIRENPRLVAIILDVTLGLFGMHRLYLGTDLKVPVFYTLTFGGGGVLWLIDLGLLIFSSDITSFMDNPKLFMWSALPEKDRKSPAQVPTP